MSNLGAKILQKIGGMQKEVLYDIFVYIHKVYDAMGWGSALEILEVWGGGGPDLPTPYPILGWRNLFLFRCLVVRNDSGSTPQLV